MLARLTSPPKFADLFAAQPAVEGLPEDLDRRIAEKLAIVRQQQGDYQPIFGVDSDEDSSRKARLLQNCSFVEKHFAAVARKQQIRILDIGSNAGFVSFTLAQTFPQVMGFEINKDLQELSSFLALKTQSPARFANIDLLEMIDNGSTDFENVDAVLLFNVVHQLIFARGLPYVQTALKKLVDSVDAVFIELATRDEYVPHKKDHLLPIEAEEVFRKCTDCEITLLKRDVRPFYLLKRRRLQLQALDHSYNSVVFSYNENRNISRKYYSGTDRFLKQYRFTAAQNERAFEAEVKALAALEGKRVGPTLIDWGSGNFSAYLLMERVYGPVLVNQFARYDTTEKQKALMRELLRIGHELSLAGICQNDFSAHNMIAMSDGTLRLVDFEGSLPHPVQDNFAFLAWLINDLQSKRGESYERNVFQQLELKGRLRASPESYPDKERLVQRGLNAEFVEDMYQALDWNGFVAKWNERRTDI